MLRVLGAEKYKGMTRVTFIAGRRVLADSRRLRQEADTVSRALKIPVNGISGGVLALNERCKDMEKKLSVLKSADARREAEDLLRDGGALIQRLYTERGMDDVLLIGRTAQKKTGAVLLLASEPDRKFAVLCSTKGVDIKALIGETCEKYGVQGGGGGGFFQGLLPQAGPLKTFLDEISGALSKPR
jgi:alanyl-tRNA synthetase